MSEINGGFVKQKGTFLRLLCKKLGATILFVGDDWYGTEKWQEYEKAFAAEGISIVYFPYTKGVSSTQITKALNAVRE